MPAFNLYSILLIFFNLKMFNCWNHETRVYFKLYSSVVISGYYLQTVVLNGKLIPIAS
jgi:hypothetical protein